jgi:hypothetical protein
MNMTQPIYFIQDFWVDVLRGRDRAGGDATNVGPDGWPLTTAESPPVILSHIVGVFNPGVYTVDWVGNGTFTIDCVSASANETFVATGAGSDTIDLSSLPGRGTCSITIDATGSPHVQPRMYHSKYNSTIDGTPPQVLIDERVDEFQQTGAVRGMSWLDINLTEGIDNATDPAPGWIAPSWAVVIQWQVEVANQLGRDLWVNIPHEMDDTGIGLMVDAIETSAFGDPLDAGLKWHLEFSNEMWNTVFIAHNYAVGIANAAIAADDPRYDEVEFAGDLQKKHRFQAVRSVEIHDIVAAHGSAPAWNTRCIRTLGGQIGDTTVVGWLLDPSGEVPEGYDKHFDAYAVAPYLFLQVSGVVDLDDVDAAFVIIDAAVTSNIASILAVSNDLATYESGTSASPLPQIAYEWGQHVYSDNPSSPWTAFVYDIQHDPRMYDAYRDLLDGWEANGGNYPMCHWQSPQPTDQYGGWGIKEDYTEPNEIAMKWSAILDWQHDNP